MGKTKVPLLLSRGKGVNEEKGTDSSEADLLALSIPGLAKKKKKGKKQQENYLSGFFPKAQPSTYYMNG